MSEQDKQIKQEPDESHGFHQVNERVIRRFRCEGCGEYLNEYEVYPDGDSFTHTVPTHVCGGDEERCWRLCPEPVPCGPVVEIEEETNYKKLKEGGKQYSLTAKQEKAHKKIVQNNEMLNPEFAEYLFEEFQFTNRDGLANSDLMKLRGIR